MKTRKAKAPDPGAYGEDDITPEDRKRAKDAKAQAADGKNPPSWVSDEETWSRAKEAADKTYDEGDDAYWPAVVHIYGNMGGEIQAKASKAGGEADGGTWISMEGGRPLFIAEGESAGQALARQSGGAAGDAKGGKTGEKQRATAGKLKDATNKIATKIKGSSTEAARSLFAAGRHVESAIQNLSEGRAADAANDFDSAIDSMREAGSELSDDDADSGPGINAATDKISAMRADLRASLSGSRAKKAMHAHADMADVVEMMSEHEMSESDMVEMSGLDAARVKALLHDGEKPTVDELAAMTDACEECEKVTKHGDHDQASHGDRGFSSVGSFAGSVADRIGEKYPSAAGSLRDASDALRAAHDHESKGDGKKAKENARNAGRSLREARNALRGTGSAEDEDVESMMNDVKEYAASMGKSVSPESVLKAGLGMSDGEFRRMLGQAVYARWGKQAAVDEVFPETQVALVKAWEGEAWMSGFRLLSVPYDAEDGAVTLGEVAGEVRQTYEPVAKSDDEPDDSPCEVEYIADRDKRGEYVIGGLNGEAVTLAKSLTDAGVPARIEDGDVVFASRGAVCKQLTIRATVEGEFDPGPRSFIPYLRDEVSMRKAEEKGIVYGIVYEPDVVDKQGEWATADDIEEAAHEYLKRSRRMKRQHDEHSDSEVVESYIAPADFFFGNRMVRKGSWVVAEQLGEKSKKLYKEGKLTGFSMGGHASYAA